MIKRIWKDPVWSNVIAGVILFIGALIYAKAKSWITGITFNAALQGLWALKIKVVYVLIAFIAYLILRQIIKKKDSFYTKKQEKLRQFNKDQDPITGIQYRWTVHFSGDIPFIMDLAIFCTKHGNLPIRFINNRCPVNECENSKEEIYRLGIKNIIESSLIDRWDKIKNSN